MEMSGQFLLQPLNVGTSEMSGQFCFRRFNTGNEPLRKVGWHQSFCGRDKENRNPFLYPKSKTCAVVRRFYEVKNNALRRDHICASGLQPTCDLVSAAKPFVKFP